MKAAVGTETCHSEIGPSNRERLANVMLDTAAQLHRPGRSLQAYRLSDWLEFVLWLDGAGILLPLVTVGAAFPFDPVKWIVDQKVAQYKARQDLLNGELERFSRCARANQLRFVSLKGPALSTALYGSPYARQSTDIDILVEAEDCDKAGYVARLCGFKQPLEYCALRDEGALGKGLDEWSPAPFQIRRRWDSDSLSEYVKVVDGHPVVIDVHDRISRIGQPGLRAFSWKTSCVSFGSIKVNGLAGSALVAYLILASHDDSEGYAPNNRQGTLGLKLYYDLLVSLFTMGKSCFIKAVELLRGLGESGKAAKVIANLIDLFPGQFNFLPTAETSLPNVSYRSRFADPSERKIIAFADALAKLTGPQRCNAVRKGDEKEIRWGVCSDTMVTAQIAVAENLVHVVWSVPSAMLLDIGCFIFQFRLNLRDSTAEIRANMFSEDGDMYCDVVASPCFSRSGKAGKVRRGAAVEVTVLGHSEGGAQYAIAIDLGVAAEDFDNKAMLVNGGVFKNHCGSIYREVWRDEMTIDGLSMFDVKL